MVDGYKIYVNVECSISRAAFIPKKECGQPHLVVVREQVLGRFTPSSLSIAPYFMLSSAETSLGDKWMFDGNDDPLKKVPLTTFSERNTSEQLFSLLMGAPDTPLKFMTRQDHQSPIRSRTIVLSEFKPNTEELIEGIRRNWDWAESRARREILIGIALLVAFLSVTSVVIFLLVKQGRKRLKAAQQKTEIKRVARVAEDEAIRELVRSKVKDADENSLSVLRSQIKVALDSGDTQTAEELLKILKQLSPARN